MSDVDPNARLWDLLRGGMCTRALGIAADLGVADALAGGPRPVAELARANGADPDTLHRILRALASDGVFAEEDPGTFRNTEASELLRRGVSGWPEFAHLFGGVFYDAVGTLDPRTDRETFTEAFGTDFWSWLGDNPDERAIFDAAMASEGAGPELLELDWRGDELVVDVGGGNGALLKGLIEHQPDLRGVILDLPETQRDESTFGDRISFVAGSFFDEVPRGGDVYILARILHDWDNERASTILQTIHAAAPQAARLLILESVISPGNDPQGSKWLDLLMLVLARGRERTEEDWRALLGGNGFQVEQIEDGLVQARCR